MVSPAFPSPSPYKHNYLPTYLPAKHHRQPIKGGDIPSKRGYYSHHKTTLTTHYLHHF